MQKAYRVIYVGFPCSVCYFEVILSKPPVQNDRFCGRDLGINPRSDFVPVGLSNGRDFWALTSRSENILEGQWVVWTVPRFKQQILGLLQSFLAA